MECSNHPMFNKFVYIMQQEMTDVSFIFESSGVGNDLDMAGPPKSKIARKGVGDDYERIIKISAHKKVLAASSPVFNAMFYGELKETGDVKIVDASSDAFQEFLEIFYDSDVYFTTENLHDVMKLIDKYDVKYGWPIVDKVFKNHFTVDDILWGLHLAVKFRRDNLIKRCTNTIKENIAKVCDMIEFDDSCKPKLRSNPNNLPMTDADLTNIFPRVYATIKKYVSKSVPVEKAGVISLMLTESGIRTIEQIEDITFSSNRTLLLTHVTYGGIFMTDGCGSTGLQFDIKVNIAETETYHEMPIGGKTVKYATPIHIQANRKYTIQTKIITKFFPLPYTDTYTTPDEPVQVASNIQITFDKIHSNSIVSAIDFLRYDH